MAVCSSRKDISLDYSEAAVPFAGPDLDGWPWPNPLRDPSSMDYTVVSGAQENGDSLASKPVSVGGGRTRLPPQDSSLVAGLGGPEFLLNDFDDLATNLLSSINSTADAHSPPEDPVEKLSKLHLELYQCLTLVKLVDKLKKERLRNKSVQPGDTIDTSWSEHLFRTTERFIDALRNYASSTSTDAMDDESPLSSPRASRTGVGTGIVQIDSATGLLIVSCYMRLVQIFELVVFVVETFTEMDCPGSYVQIRFGSFVPKTDKALHARLLGHYVLHLLEGISEAVDSAVASRQPYARALADARQAEAKLKERVMATLR